MINYQQFKNLCVKCLFRGGGLDRRVHNFQGSLLPSQQMTLSNLHSIHHKMDLMIVLSNNNRYATLINAMGENRKKKSNAENYILNR